MWMNHPVTWDREMSKHTFPVRDWLPASRDNPYESWDIYLDQVHLILNPLEELIAADADPANPFVYTAGDSALYDFRVETYQLLVRFDPNGERHVMYTESVEDPNTSERVDNVITPVVYSSSMTLQTAVDAGEKYNRIYRPVRPDQPIAQNVASYHFGSPLSVELLFPILFANETGILSYVPNYRILRVLCDFSCRRR
jgi:hypothetical protein